ncbi:MAG TPA: hypothetical protein VKE51_29680 [Vicinamibacterales bacterium]|nr:hypothetical protein [Vicinamibacterales bacterium]
MIVLPAAVDKSPLVVTRSIVLSGPPIELIVPFMVSEWVFSVIEPSDESCTPLATVTSWLLKSSVQPVVRIVDVEIVQDDGPVDAQMDVLQDPVSGIEIVSFRCT